MKKGAWKRAEFRVKERAGNPEYGYYSETDWFARYHFVNQRCEYSFDEAERSRRKKQVLVGCINSNAVTVQQFGLCGRWTYAKSIVKYAGARW